MCSVYFTTVEPRCYLSVKWRSTLSPNCSYTSIAEYAIMYIFLLAEIHPRFVGIAHSLDVWHKACKLTAKLTKVVICAWCIVNWQFIQHCFTFIVSRPLGSRALRYIAGFHPFRTIFGTFATSAKAVRKKSEYVFTTTDKHKLWLWCIKLGKVCYHWVILTASLGCCVTSRMWRPSLGWRSMSEWSHVWGWRR